MHPSQAPQQPEPLQAPPVPPAPAPELFRLQRSLSGAHYEDASSGDESEGHSRHGSTHDSCISWSVPAEDKAQKGFVVIQAATPAQAEIVSEPLRFAVFSRFLAYAIPWTYGNSQARWYHNCHGSSQNEHTLQEFCNLPKSTWGILELCMGAPFAFANWTYIMPQCSEGIGTAINLHCKGFAK